MEITFDPQFIPLVNALGAGDAQRVWKAVEKYQREPDTPGLNLEQLEGRAGRRRLCTIRASQELRVLLAREGPTSVFLRAGHHDDVYRFADRVAFSAPLHGRPGLIPVRPDALELDGSPVVPTTFRPLYAPAPERSILGHWTDGELAEAGFDVDAIERLRRATDETLLEVWPSIDDATFDRVFECMEQSPDAWRQRRLIADEAAEHKRFRDTIVERGALAGLSLLLTADEFERLRAAPIEEWMIFLHPDQHALVERWFNGPARVRGSAGTGKTVVALHRAAALAKGFATSPSSPSVGGAHPSCSRPTSAVFPRFSNASTAGCRTLQGTSSSSSTSISWRRVSAAQRGNRRDWIRKPRPPRSRRRSALSSSPARRCIARG